MTDWREECQSLSDEVERLRSKLDAETTRCQTGWQLANEMKADRDRVVALLEQSQKTGLECGDLLLTYQREVAELQSRLDSTVAELENAKNRLDLVDALRISSLDKTFWHAELNAILCGERDDAYEGIYAPLVENQMPFITREEIEKAALQPLPYDGRGMVVVERQPLKTDGHEFCATCPDCGGQPHRGECKLPVFE